MSDWKHRLTRGLEPNLRLHDPRKAISAYDNMPYAIFYYPPAEELAVRKEIGMLRTRLERDGKRLTVISLAECLDTALAEDKTEHAMIAANEIKAGVSKMSETLSQILGGERGCEHGLLTDVVARQLPHAGDPHRDIFFLVRAGALFPFYRTSAICEQLMGKTNIPGVLFYPGSFDGVTGLSFMDIHDTEPNYRPKIF
jgi:hypothetical protein